MQYEQTELQPIETCTHAWKRRSRCMGSFAANARSSAVPKLPRATPSPPAPSQSREMGDRAGAERDVDVRVEIEDALALRLRVTAADRDDRVRPFALALGGVPHVRGEALVGLLADRARVEDEDVRLVGIDRLAEPELLERALDPLGVVGVHLATERRDVVAAHRGQGTARHSRD